jgi:hypothetical protein
MFGLCEQMELPLFIPRSFDDLLSLKGVRNILIAPNARLKSSWRLKIHSFSGRRTLTIPSYFENAPENIKEALIEWAMLVPIKKHRKQSLLSHQKKTLEQIVLRYIAESGNAHNRLRKIASLTFQSQGCSYDLREVFSHVNVTYFNGKLTSFIRWGKSRGRSYQTSFNDQQGQRQNLISIAQLYNRPDVPRFAIESIVYHEMLHIAIPPFKRNCKNVIHGQDFKRAERSFPYFKQWRQWEKDRLKQRYSKMYF